MFQFGEKMSHGLAVLYKYFGVKTDYEFLHRCAALVHEAKEQLALVPFPFNFDLLACHKPCPIFV